MIESIGDLAFWLRRFHARLLSTPGVPESQIPDDMPDALHFLYRELGSLIALGSEHGGPFCAQDQLLPIAAVKRIDGMVEFARENQNNWACRTLAQRGDPPVFSNAAAYWDDPQDGFVQVCDSVEHFLITLSLQEAVMSAPFLWEAEYTCEASDAVAGVEPLWLDGHYVFGEPSHSFFAGAGHDVLVMDYAGLWIAGHSAEAVQVVQSEIPYRTMR